jgi:hypothetical protein
LTFLPFADVEAGVAAEALLVAFLAVRDETLAFETACVVEVTFFFAPVLLAVVPAAKPASAHTIVKADA